MKTLPLSIELSTLALESVSKPLIVGEMLGKVQRMLSNRSDLLGKFTGSRLNTEKKLGDDLQLNEYRFDYEKHSLLFQMIHFAPKGEWQVKGFRFV